MKADMVHLTDKLKAQGYAVEKDKDFSGFRADLYARKEGHSFWKFLPYEDHIFFHTANRPTEEIHEMERAYVHALFKTPKWMRYRVPNIVTVILSEEGFSEEDIRYVSAPVPYGVGGEKHSTILIDLKDGKIHSQGLQTVRTMAAGGGAALAVTHTKANPSNRVLIMIRGMFGLSGNSPGGL